MKLFGTEEWDICISQKGGPLFLGHALNTGRKLQHLVKQYWVSMGNHLKQQPDFKTSLGD